MAKIKKEENVAEEKILSRYEIMSGLVASEKKAAIKEKRDMQFGQLDDFKHSAINYVEVTGWLAWDSLLKGYLPGRIYEIYGTESSGKTSTLLQLIEKLQMIKPDLSCEYIDAEQSINLQTLKRFKNLDPKKLFIMQESIIEEIWIKIEEHINAGAVDLIIIDSIGALQTVEEQEKTLYDNVMMAVARKLSRGFRRLYTLLPKKKVSVIFVNQTRVGFSGMFAIKETMGETHSCPCKIGLTRKCEVSVA